MNNLELTYIPYSAKLKKPFVTSGTTITDRNGFIIFLKNENKASGIGEAAPLPGFGSETYEEAEKALGNLTLKLDIDFQNIAESIEQNLKNFDKLPSLKCGLELAILKLICNENKISIPDLLKRETPEYILVNGIISLIDSGKAAGAAVDLIKKGFNVLKIKVGRNDFEEDLQVVSQIRMAAGDVVKLRIDANAKWNKEEALEFLTKLEPFNIEYAEQPVKDFNDFLFLKDKVKIPLAADESVRSFKDGEKFIANEAALFLILKPMMLGGIIPTLKITDAAQANGIKSIVTSSFENAIGRIGIVNAAALINNGLAHGLAAAEYFNQENVPDTFPVSEGKILFRK